MKYSCGECAKFQDGFCTEDGFIVSEHWTWSSDPSYDDCGAGFEPKGPTDEKPLGKDPEEG